MNFTFPKFFISKFFNLRDKQISSITASLLNCKSSNRNRKGIFHIQQVLDPKRDIPVLLHSFREVVRENAIPSASVHHPPFSLSSLPSYLLVPIQVLRSGHHTPHRPTLAKNSYTPSRTASPSFIIRTNQCQKRTFSSLNRFSCYCYLCLCRRQLAFAARTAERFPINALPNFLVCDIRFSVRLNLTPFTFR